MKTQSLQPTIKLLITKGPDEGKVFETTQFPFTIGRGNIADFVLENDSVMSRKHASIEFDGVSLWIDDLGSKNGTFLDNIQINKKSKLLHGSIFILGNNWIKVVISSKHTHLENSQSATSPDTAISITKKKEAILVIDQQDSSALADQYGDDSALKITKKIIEITTPLARNNRAQFIKSTGDGFLVTFSKSEEALKTARDILKKVLLYNKEKERIDQIKIRIGLNYGSCNVEPSGERYGTAVIKGFRVEGLKFSDRKKREKGITRKKFPDVLRIFATEDFVSTLSKTYQNKFQKLGGFKLKGIKEQLSIYWFRV